MLKYFYTLFFVAVMGNSFAQNFNYAVMNRKNIIHSSGNVGYSKVINPKLILTSNLWVTLLANEGKAIPSLNQGSVSFGEHYLIINKDKWKTATTLRNYYEITYRFYVFFFPLSALKF